jgi:hypothetical protein
MQEDQAADHLINGLSGQVPVKCTNSRLHGQVESHSPELSITNASNTLAYWTGIKAPDPHSGDGLDAVYVNPDRGFYGQKRGLIADCTSVFEFNDQRGFVLCFESPAQPDNGSASWHPDFTAAMNHAKTVNWTKDLFQPTECLLIDRRP